MSDQSAEVAARQIPAQVHTVGPGWVPLLARLHADLSALASDYQIEDLGAEFGRLRLDLADRFDDLGEFEGEFTDTAAALVDAAVLASQQTCEDCGAEGRPRFRGDQHRTWIRTLCDRCRHGLQSAEPVRQATAESRGG
jgi:hypothetical protein